jgi:hypothetical protein
MHDRSSSGLICRAKSTFSAATAGEFFDFFAMGGGFSVVEPNGRTASICH